MASEIQKLASWMLASDYGPRAVAERRYVGAWESPVDAELRDWGIVCGLAFGIVSNARPDLDPSQTAVLAFKLAESVWGIVAPRDIRAGNPECPLTDRQLEVLVELGMGKSYKQIATDSQLSVSTIRTHLHNVYSTLGVADRAQAVVLANRLGWLPKGALFAERGAGAPQ